MHRPKHISIAVCLLLALVLAGCDDEPEPTLQQFPTTTPTPLFGGPLPPAQLIATQVPATMIPTEVEPTITPPPITLPPALALPDSSGVSVACAGNTLRLPLKTASGAPVAAAIRLLADGDALYVLADGGLYRIERARAETGDAAMESVIAPGNTLSGRPVQELVDLALDPTNQTLVLLDKAGHVYRYDPAAGTLGLAYRAAPENDEVDGVAAFQFVSVTVDDHGRVLLLDVSRGQLWEVQGQETLAPVNTSKALPAAVDVAAVGDTLFTLQRNGTLRASDGLDTTNMWRDSDPRPLGLSIRTSMHLGIPLIVAVDALRREVTTYIPGGAMVTRHAFAFPDLGLLRDAEFASQHLYALGGSDLLVYPGPAGLTTGAACPDYNPDTFPTPALYGLPVIGVLKDLRMPLDNASLPDVPHLYPGAMRLYRLGVHHGTDLYGFDKGTPVYAAASGTIAEAVIDYQPMSYNEFLQLTAESEMLGQTPPENLDRLDGRRIIIDHGSNIRTLYAHLDSIAPGIYPGVHVDAGTLIGTVGVSGTSAEGRPGTESPHLHFEIWLGNHYIGQDISIRETMWWLSHIMDGQ